MLLDMLYRITRKKYEEHPALYICTEALKLHAECIVQMKNTKFPLIFSIVYAAWKLRAGISK